MSAIPKDIEESALAAWTSVPTADWEVNAVDVIAKAILAERQRCIDICRQIGEIHNDGYYNVPNLIAAVIEGEQQWP